MTNAVIYQHDNADTLVVQGTQITFIGKAAEARKKYPNLRNWQDLEKAFIGPGFIDNHNHVFEADAEIGGDCDLSDTHNVRGYEQALQQCGRELALEPNDWLMGYGHELAELLKISDESPLALLDRLFPDNPVVLMEQTSHSMWVNSKALQQAGINQHSTDPQGGRMLRETDGSLSGILLDNAGDRLFEMAWKQQPDLKNAHKRGLQKGLRQLAENGITTVGDGRLYWKRGWLETWQELEKQKQLTARVSIRPWIYPADPAAPQLEFFRKVYQPDTSRLLVIHQVKLYSDGLLQNGTARLLQPYRQTINPDLPTGLDYIGPDQLQWWLVQLDDIGYGAHIHAIGDGGTRQALDAVAHARAEGSTRLYGLTHLELVQIDDLARFKALGVDADVQIGNEGVLHADHRWAEPWLGHERAVQLMPVGALRAAGANLTLSSDWNVNDLNPLISIANALELKGQQFPDTESAIDAYTINAAKALGLEGQTGSLTVGKAADLVVIDQDISRAKPARIRQAKFLLTMMNGQVVYQSADY
ncbi:amidohydrolase [Rheinheimera riviphila]|uniref:amidohydrolase n=1 Tax=Rheinheimera riviphila TaxID=1834037 RepID=UPI001981EA84|nr:amidohydrolase [Rheinheimera riviphila]